MNLAQFRQQLILPHHLFKQTLDFISAHYQFTPTIFNNGVVINDIGQNEGTCKILALAFLENFSDKEALLAFGEHYYHVLQTPNAKDHLNIRQLLKTGLAGVKFERFPLIAK